MLLLVNFEERKSFTNKLMQFLIKLDIMFIGKAKNGKMVSTVYIQGTLMYN